MSRSVPTAFPTAFLAILSLAIALTGAPSPTLAFQALKLQDKAPASQILQVASRREKITKYLEDRGYSDIEFQGRRLFGYVVHACRDGRQYRISFDPLTIRRGRQAIGDCPTGTVGGGVTMTPREVRRMLRDDGFRRIRFFDNELPRYGVNACRNGRSFRLVVGRRGRIIEERDTGRCAGTETVATAADVRQKLRALGFYQIVMVSRDLPPTRVRACKAGRQYDIRLSRNGEILSRSLDGRCTGSEAAPAGNLRQSLRQRGYYRIEKVRENANRVVFDACRGNRKFRVRMNPAGGIVSRDTRGWCAAGNDTVRPVNTAILDHFPSGGTLSPEDCDDYLNALLDRTRIRFKTGSSDISQRSARLLEEVGYVMNMCRDTTIEVAGHTDSRGSTDLNDKLSRERARSVVRYLVRNHGVARRRLKPVGYGESRPIASNNTERGRRRNRRIEMVVLWSE